MTCPQCQTPDTRVVDSRVVEDGTTIRRRRECSKCGFRFSTIEELEILALTVIKRDNSEELYDPEKLTTGLKLALRKRQLTADKWRQLVRRIEQDIQCAARHDRVASAQIGEIVMRRLKKTDQVAYIRFASVYRSFTDIKEFADELQKVRPRRVTHPYSKNKN